MDKENATITIPASLFEKIEAHVKSSGKESVEEYIVRILEESLPKTEADKGLSEEDEEKVKERLKALGYL